MTRPDFVAYAEKCAAARALAAEILPVNKQVLFAALAAAGIAMVIVEFDGTGDSGQIEAVIALTGENTETELPDPSIEVKTADFDTATVVNTTTTLHQHIEHMAYDFLEETHSGWEDGEGAYGEFRFSLADRSITLGYHERYVETHFHEHTF